MHPALILLIGIFSEAFVQFAKRATYLFGSYSPSLHYPILLVGDVIFFVLFLTMLLRLKFKLKHWIIIGAFLLIFAYTIFINGPVAALLSVRNTYLWILIALLFAASVERPLHDRAAQSIVNVTKVLAFILVLFAIIQVQSDYAFEKPWFEFSGTSLSYDGVTNFGQAAKAFSLMSGPTDFAAFGLFVLAVGIATRTCSLGLLGATIILMSGTRGILLAIPVWIALTWVSTTYVRRNYLILIGAFFSIIFLFSKELIALLYALPNSRFSLATLAPRIEIWLGLDPMKFIIGGGLAANISIGNVMDSPNVIDSGLIYFLSEIGAPFTFGLVYVLLTAARHDLSSSKRGVLQMFIGVLLIASIAQIPLYTRLSNFFICLLIYSDLHYAKNIQIYRLRWSKQT